MDRRDDADSDLDRRMGLPREPAGAVREDGRNVIVAVNRTAEAERNGFPFARFIEVAVGMAFRTFADPFGACTTELATARPGNPHEVSRIDMYDVRQPALRRRSGAPLGCAQFGLRGLDRMLRGA